MAGWFWANTDYFAYTGVCVTAFAVLDLWLRRRRPAGRLPRWVWPALAALLVAGWFFVTSAGRMERDRIRGFLEGIAPTYARELALLGHANLRLDTPPGDPAYLTMIEAMKRWKSVNPAISDIYTYRIVDGQIRFIVDSETDYDRDGVFAGAREGRVPIGQEYQEADPPMFEALAGVATFSDDPVQDEWGTWVSAQVPIRAPDGQVEAALGVDYPAASWSEAIAFGRQRMEWFLAIPVLILGFSGAMTGVLRAELGARRAVEAQLRESEAHLRTAIDSLPSDLWVMDTAGHYVMQNETSRSWWGDRLGHALVDLPVEPAVRQLWGTNNRRAFAGEVVREEARISLRGTRRDLYTIIAPVKLGGRVTGILGVNIDVTDRVAAEESRRQSEQRLSLHVHQTPLAVIECDPCEKITAWNPAAERIFGYTREEAIGRPASDLIGAGPGGVQTVAAWRALRREGGSGCSTHENLTKDGRSIVCEWTYTLLVSGEGSVIGIVALALDVSERVAMDKRLQQAQKLESIGQLAAGVAHEFNNLLTPMMIQVGMLQDAYYDNPQMIERLRPIDQAITQAAELNRRILSVGRKASDPIELLRLGPLVKNAVELLRHTLDRRIEMTIELDSSLGVLAISQAAVSQILMNLALNARDTLLEKLERAPAGPLGEWRPRLIVRTRSVSLPPSRNIPGKNEARLCQCLSVNDNGLGIAAPDRSRLFEPFFTTKAPGKGTGLGLAVVWGAVNQLGGWIEVESEPGQGTTFQIYFPQPTEPGAPLREANGVSASRWPHPTEAGQRRILLVEDNTLVMHTVASTLERAGYRVTQAQDGEQAWLLIDQAETDFDLLLTDLNMPRLSGRDLLVRLRENAFEAPVMVLSGLVDAEQRKELEKLGAHAILSKPIAAVDLLGSVARTLAAAN